LFFLRFGGFLGPLRSAGHSATLIKSQGHDDRMVIIFGHSPLYGYLNTVQEFVFGEFILYPYFLWPTSSDRTVLNPTKNLVNILKDTIWNDRLIESRTLLSHDFLTLHTNGLI